MLMIHIMLLQINKYNYKEQFLLNFYYILKLKIRQEMEIGNKDFLGKKRNESNSKDITPMKSGSKMKYS